MNTVSTPKGGQYKIQLPDGTNVWLNAASSITYPTAFTGNKREVIIDGEAYLEVKSNKGQPFFVTTKTSAIQVLGTSFNINAYEDEPSKTSLIEGSIKVALRPSGNAPGSSGFILKPGQAYKNGKVITTDIDQDIAWKNGLFNFEGLGVKEVMNQLQRWYDIEVIYEGEIPDVSFYGKIHKNVKLSIVLDALRDIGVQFRMEGERKLMVSP